MPPFDQSLTPATVIINKDRQSAIIQSNGNAEIRELDEKETDQLLNQLRPGRETRDGIVCKTTLESIPDIGNVEEDDWCKFEIEEGG